MDKILVVGSMGYDLVFEIHGNIKDKIQIKDSRVHSLDLLFTAKKLTKRFGGTAGNISYGLSLLGSPHTIFSIVGDDYLHDYKAHLESGLVTSELVVLENQYTATFYAASDEEKNLIGVWQPNAYSEIDDYSLTSTLGNLSGYKYAIFSPGTDVSITKHLIEFKQENPDKVAIFDPGQITNFFDTSLMKSAVDNADIIIGNEVEIPLIEKKVNQTVSDLSKSKIVIKTLGENGVDVYSPKENMLHINAVKVDSFVEATGAGDAFRAGLLHGLAIGLPLEKSVQVGISLGAANVQSYGGQTYVLPGNTKSLINNLVKGK